MEIRTPPPQQPLATAETVIVDRRSLPTGAAFATIDSRTAKFEDF